MVFIASVAVFKSDSHWGCLHRGEERDYDTCDSIQPDKCTWSPQFIVGKEDMALMRRLSSYGPDHRKFMRMLPGMYQNYSTALLVERI